MPIGWFSSFQEIPWRKALDLAPTLVEGGRNLWARLSKADESQATTRPAAPQQSPDSEGIAEVAVRVHNLETTVAGLKEEAVSSFEVVRSLTEQHSQVVRAVDTLITRTKVLLNVCLLLAIGLLAAFLFILIGR